MVTPVLFLTLVSAIRYPSDGELREVLETSQSKFLASNKATLKLPDAASDMFAPMRALLASEMKTLQEVAVKLKAKVREEEKDKYAAAAEADKAKVKTAFGPECASKLQDIVDNLHDTAASRDYEEHLGLSVATYFKVQCYNGLPVGAKDCDKSAVELYKLVDSGNSLYNKTAHEEAKAAAEEGAEEFLQKNMTNAEAKAAKTPESGEKWCESFFDVFFDAVVAAQSEGEEKAEFVQTFQNDKEKAAWFKKFWKGPDCECIGKTQGPDCECIGAKPKTGEEKAGEEKAELVQTFQNDKEKAAWFKKFWKGPDCACIGKTQGPDCECIGAKPKTVPVAAKKGPDCACIGKTQGPDCECIGAKPKTVQQKSAIKKALRASTK